MNEPRSYLGELNRDQIVGHKLVEIVGAFKSGEGVCDLAFTFYRLDSGVVFTLPGPWADGIAAEEPPTDAKRITHPLLEQLLDQEIVEVYRVTPEADVPDDSPYLALQNGYFLTDTMGSPQGISSAGLWVYRPDEIRMSGLVPFWRDG